MKKAQIAFSSLLAACCVAYLYFVSEMEIGNLGEPGPGFTPMLVGVAGLVCALVILGGALRRDAQHAGEAVDRAGLIRLLAYLAVSVVFVPLFVKLGAVPSIFLAVFVLAKLLGERRWVAPLVLAAVSAATTYVLFVRMLDVPLPRGIL